MKHLLSAVVIGLTLTGCATQPVPLNSKFSPAAKPAYEDYMDYYAFGLIGHAQVNMQKVCMDQKIYGIQRTFAVDDGIITFLTFGIYTPMTVRVWCGD